MAHRFRFALLVCMSLAAVSASAQKLDFLPGGMLLNCSLDDPSFSTKTVAKDDPVICHIDAIRGFGRGILPHGSFMTGKLEDAKEPGHFVGKGWISVQFDRLVMPGVGSVDLTSKVAGVPKYKTDTEGHIDGKGHAKRDAAEWMIPVLIPVKIMTLPGRGPVVKLKGRTELTLRLMEDVELPPMPKLAYNEAATTPVSYRVAPVYYRPAPRLPVVKTPIVLVMKDQSTQPVQDFWIEEASVRWLGADGKSRVVPVEDVDLATTFRMSRQ